MVWDAGAVRRFVTHAMILIVVLAVAACGVESGSPQVDEEAKATVCQDVSAVVLSVGRLSAMDPQNTPAQDIQRAIDPLNGELQALSNAILSVSGAHRDVLEVSAGGLDRALATLDGPQPISLALAAIEADLDAAAGAFRSYLDTAPCGGIQVTR